MQTETSDRRPLRCPTCVISILAAYMLLGLSGVGRVRAEATPSILLITLDTTRADSLGCYGNEQATTPNLDRLAAEGLRYLHAIAPAPLTLPSHASLLTGLAPPQHGLRDNGVNRLPETIPTLATVLTERGYATGAVVASLVLDRRFGLARGFDRYDDEMAAERRGEYGYPERDARAVTDAAIDWLTDLADERPFFLWVHYYDPHSPYAAPGSGGDDEKSRYAGEVAFVDGEIGRLLAALPERPVPPVVAAVGDHGEALGEHGERTHGIFLYGSILEVPLLLSGPGVRSGRVVDEPVAIRRLAPTLLELAGLPANELGFGEPLPGLASRSSRKTSPVFSESRMPASAYGWSALESLTTERWRLIAAPRPELYDLTKDPGELNDLADEETGILEELMETLSRLLEEWGVTEAPAIEVDAETAAALRSLGYLSGSTGEEGEIDPKDGIAWLAELEEVKRLTGSGSPTEALRRSEALVERNPRNVPFLSQLARAQAVAGQPERAVETLRAAIEVNPALDFLHLNLAELLRQTGRLDEAESSYRDVVERNSRSSGAWLGLAELAARREGPEAERQRLEEAVEAGTTSGAVYLRLAQIDAGRKRFEDADRWFAEGAELSPEWSLVWRQWGDLAAHRGDLEPAIQRYARAVQLEPRNPELGFRLGELYRRHGNVAAARAQWSRVVELAPPGSPLADRVATALRNLP